MNQVKIGWAKREISTTEPISIPGQMYIRVSEGIHDPLYTTVLCVDGGDGQDCVIFCTCDLVALRGGVIELTKQKVAAQRPEIPVNNIIMGVTHTHAGAPTVNTPEKSPDGVPIYPGAKYREFFTDQCAAAIVEAWDKRTNGGIGYGYGYAVVGHSRRTVYFKEEKLACAKREYMTPAGYATMYGKTNDPLFSHYEAGADHFLNLMFTFDAQEKLTGIVVNVPCPSQLSGRFRKLSADYWNEVRQLVAKEFGEDVFVLPQCAAAGDLSPMILHYDRAQQRRMELKYGITYDSSRLGESGADYYAKSMAQRYDVAERILEGIVDVYGWAKKDIRTQLPVRHVGEEITLERRKITEEEKAWCEENLKDLKYMAPNTDEMTPEQYRVAKSKYDSMVRRNNLGVARYTEVQEEPTIDMPAHMVQIGDIAFATTRFELFMDFMHRLQARSPFIQTFVIQLAGAENGNYLATHRGVDAKGYSASMFCNVISADGGQQWVEETLRVLNNMKKQDNE